MNSHDLLTWAHALFTPGIILVLLESFYKAYRLFDREHVRMPSRPAFVP